MVCRHIEGSSRALGHLMSIGTIILWSMSARNNPHAQTSEPNPLKNRNLNVATSTFQNYNKHLAHKHTSAVPQFQSKKKSPSLLKKKTSSRQPHQRRPEASDKVSTAHLEIVQQELDKKTKHKCKRCAAHITANDSMKRTSLRRFPTGNSRTNVVDSKTNRIRTIRRRARVVVTLKA